MRAIGIDPGTTRIGVAVSDEDGVLATPRTTLAYRGDAQAASQIVQLASDEGASAIVIGLPLGLDGREGLSSRRARSLAKAIEAKTALAVVLWDERFTSAAAERSMASAGMSAKKRRGNVDRVAAAILLQSYLDAEAAKRAR